MGHVIRMDNGRVTKKTSDNRPHEKKKWKVQNGMAGSYSKGSERSTRIDKTNTNTRIHIEKIENLPEDQYF